MKKCDKGMMKKEMKKEIKKSEKRDEKKDMKVIKGMKHEMPKKKK